MAFAPYVYYLLLKVNLMCGIFGIYNHPEASNLLN
jgi:hypothetical protein